MVRGFLSAAGPTGDVVRLGPPSAVNTAELVVRCWPLRLCVTRMRTSKTAAELLKPAAELLKPAAARVSAALSQSWDEGGAPPTAIVTEKPIAVTVKALRAVLCGIPTVAPSWVHALADRGGAEGAAGLSDPLPDFADHSPGSVCTRATFRGSRESRGRTGRGNQEALNAPPLPL